MREVNFSIPNVNKASVHITTTLYDRRALDCTSTLPLINSLNHLAYLTTSSARIRDILTVDGGVERLVCILKEGRSKDDMHMWKWNLAFQCIVNIGVRGSEAVRTRVVEADMVPVIATILYDYILVIEREKAKADVEKAHRHASKGSSSSKISSFRDVFQDANNPSGFYEHQLANSDIRQARRQAPPPSLDLPPSYSAAPNGNDRNGPHTGPVNTTVLTSPPERTVFTRSQLLHHQHRSHENRIFPNNVNHPQPPATAVPSTDTSDVFSLRPVRDVDRLPSMLPPMHTGVPSNPASPTTPLAPVNQRVTLSPVGRRFRRPSIRHQVSTSGDSDDVSMEDVNTANEDTMVEQENATPIGRSRLQIETVADGTTVLEPAPLNILEGHQQVQGDNVDIAQETPIEGPILNGTVPPADNRAGDSPIPNETAATNIPLNAYPNLYLRSSATTASANALMPRDEDVLMGLQLLAYISKYCDLRHYFQATHLVPRLQIDREVEKIYGPLPDHAPLPEPTEDEYEEFLQPDEYNVFPLVEKFTVPHYPKDMSYWACVVMRNLCRKDDVKGGIRQCANYKCGKWEEFTRQFAKCRRCRRTKYCSKVR